MIIAAMGTEQLVLLNYYNLRLWDNFSWVCGNKLLDTTAKNVYDMCYSIDNFHTCLNFLWGIDDPQAKWVSRLGNI